MTINELCCPSVFYFRAPFKHEIVPAAQQLPLPHRDPAHRFLAATAQVMESDAVTSDDLLLGRGTIRTMKNGKVSPVSAGKSKPTKRTSVCRMPEGSRPGGCPCVI